MQHPMIAGHIAGKLNAILSHIGVSPERNEVKDIWIFGNSMNVPIRKNGVNPIVIGRAKKMSSAWICHSGLDE